MFTGILLCFKQIFCSSVATVNSNIVVFLLLSASHCFFASLIKSFWNNSKTISLERKHSSQEVSLNIQNLEKQLIGSDIQYVEDRYQVTITKEKIMFSKLLFSL